MLKSILGKNKSKRYGLKANINSIIDTKRRGGITDWDGDGVKNWNDCKPFNTMRQDKTSREFGIHYNGQTTLKDNDGKFVANYFIQEGPNNTFCAFITTEDDYKIWESKPETISKQNLSKLKKQLHAKIKELQKTSVKWK